MERGRLPQPLAADPAVPSLAVMDPRRTSELRPQGVVWDTQAALIEGVATAQPGEWVRGRGLAVIALGTCPSPGDSRLEGMRSLKRNGLRILCYEEGSQSWPLGKRCEVFLAGASSLLDSAKGEFPQDLRRNIMQLVRDEGVRQDEHAR